MLDIKEKIASSCALIKGIGSWTHGIRSVRILILYVRKKSPFMIRKWKSGLIRRRWNIEQIRNKLYLVYLISVIIKFLRYFSTCVKNINEDMFFDQDILLLPHSLLRQGH